MSDPFQFVVLFYCRIGKVVFFKFDSYWWKTALLPSEVTPCLYFYAQRKAVTIFPIHSKNSRLIGSIHLILPQELKIGAELTLDY